MAKSLLLQAKKVNEKPNTNYPKLASRISGNFMDGYRGRFISF